MQAICKLFDFLYSEEGRRLTFAGFEGEDYDVVDGTMVAKEGVILADKYQFASAGSSLSSLALWNPSAWDISFPSSTPMEYRQLTEDRHMDAVENGTIRKYYDEVKFLSTPLKDKFALDSTDFMTIMMGNEPVDKMVDDMMARYEKDGLSEMLAEVNVKAKEAGINP